MDIGYKLNRVMRWSREIGLRNALWFEIQQTLHRDIIRFRHKNLADPIYLRGHSSDISVFEAIFIGHELDFHLAAAPATIVDAGANVGLSALYLAMRFPDAQIVAIEPAADNVAMLHRNLDGLPNVRIVQSALWSRNARLRITNPEAEAWSYRCDVASPDDRDGFDALTLDAVLDLCGLGRCDLLKIDIEGAETELFRAPGPWLDAVSTIVVEIHDEATRDLISGICPSDTWRLSQTGEKMLLRRRARDDWDATATAPERNARSDTPKPARVRLTH